MRKLLLLTLLIIGCSSEKEREKEKLISKLDEMKQCLKYADQDQCEDKVGIQVFKDKGTGQMMFKDEGTGNFVLPTQGQNGQPQFQTFQSYPPPQVINNYIPQQSHSNADFFMGTMMGMTLAHGIGGGSYYAPPSYSRGNTTINKTTIVKNYNRPYSESRSNRLEKRRAERLERRERSVKARELKQERRERRESSSSSRINLSKNRSSSRSSSYSSPSRSSYGSSSSSRSSSSRSSSSSSSSRRR
jgi:hypothetical protein